MACCCRNQDHNQEVGSRNPQQIGVVDKVRQPVALAVAFVEALVLVVWPRPELVQLRSLLQAQLAQIPTGGS
jgi:hypothetical protein